MEEGPESWVSTTSYRQCTHPRMFLPSLTVYMEEGPESWVSTTSYRQCTHPRMFLPSLTVYMEEGPESWVSTTSYRQCTHPRMFLPSLTVWRKVQSLGLVQRHTASVHGCFYHLTVYMEEGPESWVSTTSYRQCTHPRMFLPSLTVYMEEGPESWVSTTSIPPVYTSTDVSTISHSLHGGRSRVLG